MNKLNMTKLLGFALVAGALLWAILILCNPGGVQSMIYFRSGNLPLEDFLMTRTCAAYGYFVTCMNSMHACYPPFAPILTLPFSYSLSGAYLFALLEYIVFACAFGLMLREKLLPAHGENFASVDKRMIFMMMFCGVIFSSPVLFAVERANTIVLTAAFMVMFVTWHDSACGWKRIIAASSLAIAAVMKISPAALVFLYVAEWFRAADLHQKRLIIRDVCIFVIAGFLLFVLPFAFYDGWEGFCKWILNAMANSKYYEHATQWGFVSLSRTIRIMLHTYNEGPWDWMIVERMLSVLLGIGCLVRALWLSVRLPEKKSDILLLLTAALLDRKSVV